MNPYVAFVLAAAITYALRGSMTVAGDRLVRSKHLTTITALVTPAVLAAMVTGALAVDHGRVAAPGVTEIVAVCAAFAAARRIGNFGLSLLVGMVMYWAGWAAGLH